MAKRVRKANFSAAERAALVEEFSLRKSVLQLKFKTNSANKEKQKAWLEILWFMHITPCLVRQSDVITWPLTNCFSHTMNGM